MCCSVAWKSCRQTSLSVEPQLISRCIFILYVDRVVAMLDADSVLHLSDSYLSISGTVEITE